MVQPFLSNLHKCVPLWENTATDTQQYTGGTHGPTLVDLMCAVLTFADVSASTYDNFV